MSVTMANGEATHPASGRFGLGAALLSLSFSTVLFTLAIFKLLSFFIMPSLFFDLLFIGFPAGAFLGAAFFRVSHRAFINSLWVLQGITLLSVIAILFAKNFTYFDYLRANLFDVEVSKLLYQMATFTLLFLPFFAAYGLSEYIGYQYARRILGGRMRTVYALYLFGAAAAYVFFKLALSTLGISLLLLLAFGAMAAAVLALGTKRHRWVAGFEVASILIATLFMGTKFEASFLEVYKGGGGNSTREFRDEFDSEIAFQRWGSYSLCEIMTAPGGKGYYGFYNDFFQWEYARGSGFAERSLGMIPLHHVKPGARVAIIGAGGGRQVQYAKTIGHREIVAIEIEPAVFEAVRSPDHLQEGFDRVYEDESVTPELREARGYMEGSTEKFDLIYLPSVGGYPQMMMEPGNLIRTYEAFVTMVDRLTEEGVLAIWYPVDLDAKTILTEQYVRTLRELGLRTTAYRNPGEILVLASRESSDPHPSVASLIRFFTAPPTEAMQLAPRPDLIPAELHIDSDAGFTPITDDRPFLAGNVQHILSVVQVSQLWAIGGGVLLVAGLIMVFALRRRGDPKIEGRSYWSVVGLTLLIGANFLAMEHFLVLSLFQRTFVYYDSLMLGAIGFLVLSGVGSVFATNLLRGVFSIVALISVVALVALQGALPWWGILVCAAPVALATGTYFPALFELAARNPLTVFALDAIGAGVGTLLATFIPIVWGFQAYFLVAGVLFFLTAIASHRFFRGIATAESGE